MNISFPKRKNKKRYRSFRFHAQESLFMASENCVICLIRAMDKLWFHQMILFPRPDSLLFPEIPKTSTQPHTKSPDYSSKDTSQTCVISYEETSAVSSVVILNNTADQQKGKSSIQRSDGSEDITQETRLAQKESRNTRYPDLSTKRLQKTMSCKSLGELELEEVKGFMDLGFTFKKENLSRRVMSLIPGLQRIQAYENEHKNLKLLMNDYDYDTEQDEDGRETNGVLMRPYLSEAWLMKIPDSSLLNLRIPRVSTAANMKKQLKYWARTVVASAIRRES